MASRRRQRTWACWVVVGCHDVSTVKGVSSCADKIGIAPHNMALRTFQVYDVLGPTGTRHEQLALGHVHTAYCGDRVREA